MKNQKQNKEPTWLETVENIMGKILHGFAPLTHIYVSPSAVQIPFSTDTELKERSAMELKGLLPKAESSE